MNLNADQSAVLLVEDSAADIALTQRAFKKSGLANELVVVRDGVEALDYLFCTGAFAGRRTDKPPVVVLLDLKLPKVDGLEVLRRIRSDPRTKLQPVVILTSSREERDMIEGYSLGANSYVRKPVDFDQFADAVRQLGLYWMVVNDAPPPLTDA